MTLTTQCNLNCIMCTRARSGKFLSRQAIDKIKDVLPYVKRITWQGGEAFAHDYLEDIFNYINDNFAHVKQDIITNGILINEKWAKTLAQLNALLSVSIDSIDDKVYEYKSTTTDLRP